MAMLIEYAEMYRGYLYQSSRSASAAADANMKLLFETDAPKTISKNTYSSEFQILENFITVCSFLRLL